MSADKHFIGQSFPVFKAILFCIALIPIKAYAQSDSCKSKLWGRVVDEHDSSSLDAAMIYIVELKSHVLSDASGNYSFENLCDGSYTIDVSHIGCEPIKVTVQVYGNTQQNFHPEHHTEMLSQLEVVTENKRSDIEFSDSLSAIQMNESSGKSLGEMLTAIPGITSLNTGSTISKPMIHGMTGNRLVIINNGVKQEGQQWGSEHAPEIDPSASGEITVLRGGSAYKLGPGAMDGAVILSPAALPDSAGIGGKFSLAGFSNGLCGSFSGMLQGGFGGKLSPLSWRIQGSAKDGGNVRSPNYFQNNTGMEEGNFSYAMQWKSGPLRASIHYSQFNARIGILSWSHSENLTELESILKSEEAPEETYFTREISKPFQEVEHENLRAEVALPSLKSGELSLAYSRQYDRRSEFDSHEEDSTVDSEIPEMELELVTHNLDLTWEDRKNKIFRTSAGGGVNAQDNTGEGEYFIPNYRKRGGGIFIEEHFRKGRVEAKAGFRTDVIQQEVIRFSDSTTTYQIGSEYKDFSGWGGNAGIGLLVGRSWKFSYSSGTNWRPPAINELYSNGLHHGAAAVEYGDSSLGPERSFLNSLSIEIHDAEFLNAGISIYYNIVKDFILLSPQYPPSLTIRGAFPTFVYSQADASLSGADLFLSCRPVGKIETTFKSSILRARQVENSEWIDMMPSDRAEIGIAYFFRNRGKFGNAYVKVLCQAVAKQTRTSHSLDFAPAPPAYFLAGLEAGFDIKAGKQLFTIGLGLRNAFNTVYRDYMDRFRYYTDAAGRNISVRLIIPFYINTKSKER